MYKLATAIMLAIGAYAQKPFQSGLLQSQEPFKYGRFVAVMKASSAKGTESIFALVNDDVFQYQEEWNSINIIPSFSSENSILHSNMSLMMLDEGMQHHDDTQFSMFDDIPFHMYQIEWTPEYLSYSVDGIEIRRREFTDNPLIMD